MLQELEGDAHRFFVGTCSSKDENEIHLIQYEDDSAVIDTVAVYTHAAEVVAMAASPHESSSLGTIGVSEGMIVCSSFNAFTLYSWSDAPTSTKATLWKIPDAERAERSDGNIGSLQKACELQIGSIRAISYETSVVKVFDDSPRAEQIAVQSHQG